MKPVTGRATSCTYRGDRGGKVIGARPSFDGRDARADAAAWKLPAMLFRLLGPIEVVERILDPLPRTASSVLLQDLTGPDDLGEVLDVVGRFGDEATLFRLAGQPEQPGPGRPPRPSPRSSQPHSGMRVRPVARYCAGTQGWPARGR